jgi:hypothetical protein
MFCGKLTGAGRHRVIVKVSAWDIVVKMLRSPFFDKIVPF